MNDWWHSTDGLTVCTPGTPIEAGTVLPAPGRMFVARLDGAKMKEPDYVLYEFSDALLFPDYFGWNWNALSDCLRDLKWVPAQQYLLVVENAAQLLPDSTADRHMLWRLLKRAARSWSSSLGRDPVAFKVILMCESDDQASWLRQDIADSKNDRASTSQ